jgi:DNA-binding CsgD family transcriptional regulator
VRLDDFIDASNQIDDQDALFALYRRGLKEFGLDRAITARMQPFSRTPTVDTQFIMSYPEDWMAEYMRNNCLEIDPIRYWSLQRTGILTWEECKQQPLTQQQLFIMELAEDNSLYHGGAVSIHSPQGEVMVFGFSKSQRDEELHKSELHKVHAMAHQFHIISESLEDTHRPARHPLLTDRERSILQWCAKGKSNSSIADILYISEHAVNFHLRNIYKKLDTNNKTLAVLKAFKARLIDELPR